jgi:hypothetical protein
MKRQRAATILTILFTLCSFVAPDKQAQAQDQTAQAGTHQVTPITPDQPPLAPGGMIHRGESSIESTPLEDLLLEKGIINADDWIRIKAEQERQFNERSVVAEFTGSPRWYERITMYGYGMMRYNQTNNGQVRTYHDASVGDTANGAQPGFFFRRIRWVVTGQVSEHVAFFIQPDLASNISGNTHALSMRDAYGDWIFDKNKEYRLRVGLQRVACSFDNWQASRVRMAIDRADATNSCAPSERDMGISFMYTPKIAQARFKQMLDYGYGPGDYGVFHIQVDNSAGLNTAENNKNKRVSMRLAWPWELPGGRLMETGMNAGTGTWHSSMGTAAAGRTLYSVNSAACVGSATTSGCTSARNFLDQRINFYVYLPPQPWGFIAEYTTGRAPKRNGNGVVESSHFYGGYVQAHYQWKYSDVGLANFYSRWQEYYGGLKFQTGAPDDRMKEVETGIAWQPDPQWEFTVAYTFTQRNNFATVNPGQTATRPGTQIDAYGNLLRFQCVWFWN